MAARTGRFSLGLQLYTRRLPPADGRLAPLTPLPALTLLWYAGACAWLAGGEEVQ